LHLDSTASISKAGLTTPAKEATTKQGIYSILSPEPYGKLSPMLYFDPTRGGEEELLYSSLSRQFCTKNATTFKR
jgi:hypothetical protein